MEAEVPGGAGERAEGEGTGGAKGAGKGAELDNLADLEDFSDPEGEAALRDAERSGNGFPPPAAGGQASGGSQATKPYPALAQRSKTEALDSDETMAEGLLEEARKAARGSTLG